VTTQGGSSPRTYRKDSLKNRTGVIYEKGFYEPGSMTPGVIELPNRKSPRTYRKDTLKGRTGVIREKGYYQPGETTKSVIYLSGGRRKTRKNKKSRKSKK
jgi:hypothetical protein